MSQEPKFCLICNTPLNPDAGWATCLAHRNSTDFAPAPSRSHPVEGLDLEAIKVLKMVEFSAPHGKCPVCAGWNMGPNGETPGKHTKDCPIKKVLSRGPGEAEAPKEGPATGLDAFVSLADRVREATKKNEGWTFYLPDPVGAPGQARSWNCNYCYRPKAEHRKDGRCPIKDCSLGGPPPESKGAAPADLFEQADAGTLYATKHFCPEVQAHLLGDADVCPHCHPTPAAKTDTEKKFAAQAKAKAEAYRLERGSCPDCDCRPCACLIDREEPGESPQAAPALPTEEEMAKMAEMMVEDGIAIDRAFKAERVDPASVPPRFTEADFADLKKTKRELDEINASVADLLEPTPPESKGAAPEVPDSGEPERFWQAVMDFISPAGHHINEYQAKKDKATVAALKLYNLARSVPSPVAPTAPDFHTEATRRGYVVGPKGLKQKRRKPKCAHCDQPMRDHAADLSCPEPVLRGGDASSEPSQEER